MDVASNVEEEARKLVELCSLLCQIISVIFWIDFVFEICVLLYNKSVLHLTRKWNFDL